MALVASVAQRDADRRVRHAVSACRGIGGTDRRRREPLQRRGGRIGPPGPGQAGPRADACASRGVPRREGEPAPPTTWRAHSTRLPALQTIRARMCSARWWRPPKPGARMARSAGRCAGSSGSDGRWWLYERPQRKGAKRCEKEGETVSRAQPGCGRIWSPLEATRRRLLASWRRDGSPMSISALPAFASCAALR